MKYRLACLCALLLLPALPPAASAQERREARLITVTGEAEMRVVPDEVFFDLSVQTFHRDLKTAKSQTDERLKNLMELARRYSVAPNDVQTDYVKVEPRYRGGSDARQLLGYSVRKDLVFTLRDISRAEALLSEVIESGVTRINDIDFRTSEMRKHRDQARALAIRAAREKAVALTKELGQGIGKAYSIEEVVASPQSGSSNYMSNAVGTSGDAEDTSGTLAIGQIKVSARVVVRFELE
jgi:uncharacterized protein